MKNPNRLINKCLNNDQKAQRDLYEFCFEYMVSICIRYEKNQQDAVVLVNETYYKIILNLKKFDRNKPFLPWIKRIAINTCLDYVRSKKSNNKNTVFLDDNNWDTEHYLLDDDLNDLPELNYNDFLEMMDNLDEPAKTIFNLYAIDEYQHKEIAEILNISERTSKRYLSKARQSLQQMIIAKKSLMKGA